MGWGIGKKPGRKCGRECGVECPGCAFWLHVISWLSAGPTAQNKWLLQLSLSVIGNTWKATSLIRGCTCA